MANVESNNKLKRQFAKLRKNNNELERLPDYPDDKCSEMPRSITGEVLLKEKKRSRWRIARRYYGELSRGILKLYKSKQAEQKDEGMQMNMEFKIEIDKVPISADPQHHRFLLHFKKEVQLMTPVDTSTYDHWKDNLIKHRLYKQEQNQRQASTPTDNSDGSINSSFGSANRTVASSINNSARKGENAPATSPSDRRRVVDGLEAVTRVMDEIKEMYNMTIEVSDKTVRTCEKLQKTTEDVKGMQKEMRDILRTMRSTPAPTQPIVPTHDDRQQITDDMNTASSASNTHCTQSTATTNSHVEVAESDDSGTDEGTEETEGQKAASGIASLYCTKEAVNIEDQKREILERGMKVLTSKETVSIVVPPTKPTTPPAPGAAGAESPPPRPSGFCGDRERRTKLPAKAMPGESMGLRDFARMAVTRSGLPISNFEPLSMIQILCEELRYNNLLTAAAQHKDPAERMALIAGFAVSGYSSTLSRNRKPLNPMLGETFDYVEPTWRFHGEQVSHHPPLTAGYSEGRGWVWWQTMNSESSVSKLTQQIEVQSNLPVRIKLITIDGPEEYSIEKVKTLVKNAADIPENRKIFHLGKMKIRCTNGVTCEMFFKETREIVGEVYRNSRVMFRLHGAWDSGLYKISTTGEQILIFQPMAIPEEAKQYYGHSRFTVTLNEILQDDHLPPTDSRLRPDQRALEDGQHQRATQLKKYLEEAQRERMKRSKYTPLWFVLRADNLSPNVNVYQPTMRYWTEKENEFVNTQFVNIFPMPN